MRRAHAERATRVDRRLTRESRAARIHLTLAGALGVATAATVVAQAALLASVIARAAIDHVALPRLASSLLALAAVMTVRALLSGGFELSGRLGALRVMGELRGRLAHTLLIDRPGRRPAERTGELAAAAVQGVDSLESYFAGYLPSFVLASAVPVAVLIWVTPIDAAAAVVLLITIPILIVFMILIGKGAQAITRSRWQTLSLLSSHFLDVVGGLETLRTFRREHRQTEVLADVGDRYRRETMGTLRIAFLSALVLELCAMLGTALVAATVGVQLTGGHLSLRAGLTVLLLAPELYAPLRAVGQQFHASADGLAAAERLLDVLDQREPSVSPGQLSAPDPRAEPLRFEQVSFEYPGRAGKVLDRLELKLAPGEWVAFIGPSGAGKSTIATLALGLVQPTSGTVRCGTADLRDVSPPSWRERLAWVPQGARLFTATIAENIALSDPGATRERIERAASSAGLDDLLEQLPEGLDTAVGDGGRRLSAGERQRVALARAFLRDASLVVLDEPTANLDAASARAIELAIARHAPGRTVLMITHDPALARRADRVVEVVGGRTRNVAGQPVAVAA